MPISCKIDVSGLEPIAETAVSPSIAEGSGYAESKWISETLLAAASEITSLRSVSVRVGQISGGASGAWSRLEWFPSLIKSSVKLNALPLVDGVSTCHLHLSKHPF